MIAARTGFRFFRFLLGMLLLAWIFSRLNREEIDQAITLVGRNYHWVIGGIIMTFLGLFISIIRWQLILNALNIPLAFSRIFKLLFIGQFFNTFMPGACGGDAMRVYFVSKDSPSGQRVQAATSVLTDRAIGLFTIILYGVIINLFRIRFFQGEFRLAGFLMTLFLITGILGLIVFFRIHLFERWAFFKKMEDRLRVGELIRRAYNALYTFRSKPRVLAMAMLYSLLNMIFLTLAIVCFGYALDLSVSLIDYFTIFPLITVFASIPITPGALGFREGLFITMFQAVGVAQSLAFSLSLLGYLAGVFWGALGWFVYMGYTSKESISLREEFRKLGEKY